MSLTVGLVNENTYQVQFKDTARASGGGDYPEVLSTPRMIDWMEQTSHEGIAAHLEPGWGSVGAKVNIAHLAATPVGMQIRVRSELVTVDGRRLVFKVEAWDAVEKIGAGEHERFLILHEKFDHRLAQKSKPTA